VVEVSRNVGRGETILLVEDDEGQLWLMQNLLESNGYKVLTAKDGEQAVDIHIRHRHEIALAFLDFSLPNLNGWEAFRRMKHVNPELKGILTTGFISHSTRFRSAEFSAVLPKPFIPADALAKISAVLNLVF
jgi:two-component system cell cycle sensor histidine kinase/response regulator CckA